MLKFKVSILPGLKLIQIEPTDYSFILEKLVIINQYMGNIFIPYKYD